MNLVGDTLVIPLINADLSFDQKYDLGNGISIIRLGTKYDQKLRSIPELIARYENSLDFMKIGLAMTPLENTSLKNLDLAELKKVAMFISMTIRLSTGVPIDIPYWFDIEGEEIKGCGNTQIRTFHTGQRYVFPLDDGIQNEGFSSLKDVIDQLIYIYLDESSKNVLVKAIEFSAVAFQDRHIATRLVNNVIVIESLFSSSSIEISFQVASSVSWYLEIGSTDSKRKKLFEKVRSLYNARSRIVHGDDITNKGDEIKDHLLFGEELNTRIFKKIFNNKKHFNFFCKSKEVRKKHIKKLSLGIECELLEKTA